MDNNIEFETITNSKGFPIPKYFKDFKKLVEKDRQLAEYLCMNYESLDSEDLGAFLETVEQGISWIMELIESKDLFYQPKSGKKSMKKTTKKSLAQILVEESKQLDEWYRYFFYTLIIAQKDKVHNGKETPISKI